MSARKLLTAAVSSLSLGLLVAPAVAHAAAPSPSQPAGNIGGIVPPRGEAKTSTLSSGSNLSYHGGPVMTTNTVYTIYWQPLGYVPPNGPVMSSSYQSLIDGFFTNVATAGAAGATNNVYAVDTQYYNGSGQHITYKNWALGGSFVDTNALPANGCSDSYTSVCLSDSEIRTEIQAVMTANKWTASSTTFFVMMTANGVGSCSGSSCAFSQYCAYHGSVGTGSTEFVYANMPYADTVPSACDTSQSPNGDKAADSEINVLSHEHNEAITDEALNAWYDRRGYENGDKCAWNFGPATNTNYNQTINGAHYYVQQEWSNYTSACALTYH